MLAAVFLGTVFTLFLLPYPLAYALLLGLALFNIYYLLHRRGPFIFVPMGLLAVLILPMMGLMHEELALGFAGYLVAGGVERTPITGPIIFVAFGLVFGQLGLGFLDIDVDWVGLRAIADITLALVLFINAANADLGVLKSESHIPLRMLLIGLPLVIALGILVGARFLRVGRPGHHAGSD